MSRGALLGDSFTVGIWGPSEVCVSYYIAREKLRERNLLWLMGLGIQSFTVGKRDGWAPRPPADVT